MASTPETEFAGETPAAAGLKGERGHAVCAMCSRVFPAILTDGRCPQCRTVAPRREWGEEILGPVAAAWYGALKDPRKVIVIVIVLAILVMVLLGILVYKY